MIRTPLLKSKFLLMSLYEWLNSGKGFNHSKSAKYLTYENKLKCPVFTQDSLINI